MNVPDRIWVTRNTSKKTYHTRECSIVQAGSHMSEITTKNNIKHHVSQGVECEFCAGTVQRNQSEQQRKAYETLLNADKDDYP